MRTLIETYRDWDIYFDPANESFTTVSDVFDEQKTKPSFSNLKKWIDEYIKSNLKFEPVWIEKKEYNGINNSGNKLKLVGIRKDGRFTYENSKGDISQLSEYDEKYYIVSNSNNDDIRSQLADIHLQILNLNRKKSDLQRKIEGEPLSVIKEKYKDLIN